MHIEDIARTEGWGIYRITSHCSHCSDFPEERPFYEKDILPWCVKAYERLKKDNNFIVTHTDGENHA